MFLQQLLGHFVELLVLSGEEVRLAAGLDQGTLFVFVEAVTGADQFVQFQGALAVLVQAFVLLQAGFTVGHFGQEELLRVLEVAARKVAGVYLE